jgi:hypothetical protein
VSENDYYPRTRRTARGSRSIARRAITTFSNATPDDAGTLPDGELWVVPSTGGTPVRLSVASNPGALSWPKWAPVEHQYYGGKIMWLTFSSMHPYGLRLAAGAQTQLWMIAVDLTKLGTGQDPSFPAFWLPFQDVNGGNHIAQWSTAVVRANCTGTNDCPAREACIDGVCE